GHAHWYRPGRTSAVAFAHIGDDLAENGSWTIRYRKIAGADVDEAGDFLPRLHAERGKRPVVIGDPFRPPVCNISMRVRRHQHVEADGARGKHLFPFGDLHMRS